MARQIVQFGDAVNEILNKAIPLSRKEERDLLKKFANGDTKAGETIVFRNARFVAGMASHFYSTHLTPDDLFQVGMMGLHVALNKFNHDMRDVAFTSYATWHVHDHLSSAIREHSNTIRIPVNIQSKLAKAIKAVDGDVTLLPEDLAAAYNLTSTISTSTVLNEGDTCVGDLIAAECDECHESMELDSANTFINEKLLGHLSDREHDIISHGFGLNEAAFETLNETALRIGCSRERIRQIRDKALTKMHAAIQHTSFEDCAKENLSLAFS